MLHIMLSNQNCYLTKINYRKSYEVEAMAMVIEVNFNFSLISVNFCEIMVMCPL